MSKAQIWKVQERHPLLKGVLAGGEYRNFFGKLTQDERMEGLF